MKIIVIAFFLFVLTINIKGQVVCSEDELVREIMEDLADNCNLIFFSILAKLDCLRVIRSPFEDSENTEERALRKSAQWDSDCSFEAINDGESDWVAKLKQNYGLTKGLVDVNGNPVDKDFADQADMFIFFDLKKGVKL